MNTIIEIFLMLIPLLFSHSDFLTKATILGTFPFFFGSPITVSPAPFGLPLFLIAGGILIDSCDRVSTCTCIIMIHFHDKYITVTHCFELK